MKSNKKYWIFELRKVINDSEKKHINKANEEENYISFGNIIISDWKYHIFGSGVSDREIITGLKIPMLTMSGPDDFGDTILNEPKSSYYITTFSDYHEATPEEVDKYIKENDNEEFREALYEFIEKKHITKLVDKNSSEKPNYYLERINYLKYYEIKDYKDSDSKILVLNPKVNKMPKNYYKSDEEIIKNRDKIETIIVSDGVDDKQIIDYNYFKNLKTIIFSDNAEFNCRKFDFLEALDSRNYLAKIDSLVLTNSFFKNKLEINQLEHLIANIKIGIIMRKWYISCDNEETIDDILQIIYIYKNDGKSKDIKIYINDFNLSSKEKNKIIKKYSSNEYDDNFMKIIDFFTCSDDSLCEYIMDKSITQIPGAIYDAEIQELLDKVNNIANNLTAEAKDRIIKKRDELINQYKEDLKLEEPKFDTISNSNANLLIKDNSVGSSKKNLIIGLNNLLMLLNLEENSVKELTKINSYLNILTSESELILNPESIEDYIKSINYMAEHMDDEHKNRLKDELLCILNKTKNIYENNINIDTSCTNFHLDSCLFLDNEIKRIYNSIYPYYEKINGYIRIKKILNSTEESTEYIEQYDIFSFVNNVRRLAMHSMACASYINLKDKYNAIIDSMIKTGNIKNFIDFEIDLRKDIIPILEEIKITSEVEKANEFLTSASTLDKITVAGLFVCDILNICQNNYIDYSIKQEIVEKINIALTNARGSLLDNVPVDDVKKNLYSELADIEISLKMYIISTDKYYEVNCLNKKLK
jgi:CII-binding regulator of phage lambda lysogenization HflD